MAEDRVTIDRLTLFDNPAARQVEFSGEASGDRYDFAALYDAIEALAGRIPDGDAALLAAGEIAALEHAAARALGRSDGVGRVVVSEIDLAGASPAQANRPG